ncbi:hypothetical protein SPRG_00867 [Saprolegnia parasitica CBS 223.65]|uniref:Uncharacterized protein n=1 Tax=Saprolegnia parasitica (strain CBS 223.65) TaxID=695850 RepID=A0A067D823_SAPPC|nr:hypothetical protein SPRG_00867 [Saprolegnia parasitica CBS 223.65]KDO34806.1 hypothetical protein SPRG_00867 [Saprolegnia parasitica CBS 223.65]|eukprot:XP_012194472.1 hypothetical protein SPRG_00867 [Saprolegnia parasitica CBS 223.65]
MHPTTSSMTAASKKKTVPPPTKPSAKKDKDLKKVKKTPTNTLGAWVLPTIEPDLVKRKKAALTPPPVLTAPVIKPTPALTISRQETARGPKQPSWKTDAELSKPCFPAELHDSLHKEIVEYARYTKAIVAEMAIHIEKTIEMVRNCVRKLWPDASVDTYGSYSTGIWLPTSDIDLVILGVGDPADSPVVHLKRLAAQLRSEKWVESIVMVDTAKIPLLKLVSLDSSVPIDITFESSNTHSGLLARDLVKSLVDELPELYPLAIVFKQLLRERGLNDCYSGGVSSYSIVLMIVHFSQLWRAGPTAFKAAMIYASGSLPSEAITIEDTDKVEATTPMSPAKPSATAPSPKKLPTKPVEAPSAVKSYASVVETEPFTTLSYAAVAVGSSSAKATRHPAMASTSYASIAMKESSKDDHLEAVSVASSQADTEDTSADEREDPDQSHWPVCLGAHAVRMLEFFGCIFNYQKSGMSVRNGGFIFRLHDEGPSPFVKAHMVIEDPIHPERNVSAASFAFQKVVALFEDSYFALQYFRPTRFSPSPLSCLLSCAGHRGVHRRLMYPDDKHQATHTA